ncbi:mini-chromosome maintenance complex-binding protein-like [Zingiber officinale]|uniref:mini-chromosome maintenance complex-binding protein-like n=1 Tax=Zingiber officinale TaxID=94328 RepID=UPI001C4D7C11|nr:mini-chromosome maintenance complex-binding protein-like [Zingiber officinale]
MVGLPYDFLTNPLGAVRQTFEKSVASSPTDVDPAAIFRGKDWGAVDLFHDFLFVKGGLAQVPSIDALSMRWLEPNTLVRFRGMVQDMLGNELYVGAFKDGSSWRTNKFTDFSPIQLPPACETQLWERHLFHCVPVPGQNSWVTETKSIPSTQNVSSSASQHEGKRGRGSEDEDMNLNEESDNGDLISSPNAKKQKEHENTCSSSCLSDDLMDHGNDSGLGSGDSNNPTCLVKIYDLPESHLKLNDVFEFIGIYTFDPVLAVHKDDSDDPMFELFEDPTVDLPPSKVPRLHCLICRKLDAQDFLSNSLVFESLSTVVRGIRESLLSHLTAILGNDELAAQYLLLHLLSRVRAQVEVMSVGKLSLNLTGFTRESASIFGHQLTGVIQKLLPFTQDITLTLDYLNTATLQPRRNNKTGRLVAGVLQLAQGTHLTINETCMQSGTLSSNGIENARLLKNLLELQKVEYDFEYYKLEMAADVQLLILSEAKSSILPADLVLPFSPGSVPATNATSEDLQAWRWYLATMRSLPCSIEPEMNLTLQDEMVASMQEDKSLGCAELNRWLTMTELMSASFGEKNLSLEHWQMIKELERLRKDRLKEKAR